MKNFILIVFLGLISCPFSFSQQEHRNYLHSDLLYGVPLNYNPVGLIAQSDDNGFNNTVLNIGYTFMLTESFGADLTIGVNRFFYSKSKMEKAYMKSVDNFVFDSGMADDRENLLGITSFTSGPVFRKNISQLFSFQAQANLGLFYFHKSNYFILEKENGTNHLFETQYDMQGTHTFGFYPSVMINCHPKKGVVDFYAKLFYMYSRPELKYNVSEKDFLDSSYWDGSYKQKETFSCLMFTLGINFNLKNK